MKRKDSGQTSIFLALFLATMMMLFAFTTNIGMLVHAKINLQNAADAAAYAGAAVQARQLTNVAYLNWEMHRAVKEFMYYYAVSGNEAQTCFPFNASGQRVGICPARPPSERYSFAIHDPRDIGRSSVEFYDSPLVPTVCKVFDPNNNYCQKLNVAGVPQFLGNGSFGNADAIINTVRTTTNIIIGKKIQDCQARADINLYYLIEWLLNPDAQNPPTITSVDLHRPVPIFEPGVSPMDKLGFLVRAALLRARIDNLEEKLNLPPPPGPLTIGTINGMKNNPHGTEGVDYYERPIQAFLSANNNLPQANDNGIFSDIQLTELLPGQAIASPSPHLQNAPILAKFNDIKAPVILASSTFTPTNAALTGGQCNQSRVFLQVPNFPLGVEKEAAIPTYYAVKLRARTKLLFSPFGSDGSIYLSAYSAAKPFGSRVGVHLSNDMQHRTLAEARSNAIDPLNLNIVTIPNPLIRNTSDENSQTGGFISNGNLGYLRAYVGVPVLDAPPGGPTTRRISEYEKLRLAGAYAPWDIGFYTIPANYQDPTSLSAFPNNPVYKREVVGGQLTPSYFMLQASALPLNGPQDLNFIRNRVIEYIDSNGQMNAVFANLIISLLDENHFNNLQAYMQNPSYGEYQKTQPIPDPMLNDLPSVLLYARGAGGENYTVAAMPNAQQKQFTSWYNQHFPDAGNASQGTGELNRNLHLGRSSYSVRFLSFDSLRTIQNYGFSYHDPINGQDWHPAGSPLLLIGNMDSLTQEDLRRLKH